MKSPATKEKYFMRLGKFLDFLNLEEDSTLKGKARVFGEKGRNDNIWAFNGVLSFIQLLKERVDRKEITAGTIRNYVKSIKLFCQMVNTILSLVREQEDDKDFI
jgi:hypothetical protein